VYRDRVGRADRVDRVGRADRVDRVGKMVIELAEPTLSSSFELSV
jgi:hypothetical protein